MNTQATKHKTTTIDHPVLATISRRHSARAFSEKPIEPAIISSLFEAARWAPSSMNEQPWRYLYAAKGQELWDRLLDALDPSNQIWAQNAYLLIFNYTKTTFTKNGKQNRYAQHDLGAANAFLALQATELGLQAHQMAGYRIDKIKSFFDLPEEYEAGSMIAVGYPGDPQQLPEHLQQREHAPRERYSIGEFVMDKLS